MESEMNIVFIPWYTKVSMDNANVSISDLGNDIQNETDDKISKMSRLDFKDLILINKFMHETLFINHDGTTIGFKIDCLYNGNNIAKDAREVIETLSNNQNVNVKDTFILTYENNTIYVILKEGFSNFIKFSNNVDKATLHTELINFAFKYFKSSDIYDSRYFKNFLILNKTK